MDDGPLLRADYKTNPIWAWPRSSDPISKFWDPLITFEGIRYPLQIWYRHRGRIAKACRPKINPNWARPGSGDQFPNVGTPNDFRTNKGIRFKFGTDIMDGTSLRKDYNTTPKWAWPASRDLISIFGVPLNNLWTNWAIRFKFGQWDHGAMRTLLRHLEIFLLTHSFTY